MSGALATLAVGAVLALFVFPVRPYLNQRHQLAVETQHLRLLNSQNAALSQRVTKLQTDGEIERIAREQYHLVRPGEQAFAILPAPSPTTTTPPTPVRPARSHGGWWHHLTSLL